MGDLSADLADIVARCPDWSGLRGERLFVTGATGFFGIWLLESFAKANAELHLNAEVVALSRDPAAFAAKAPHLAANPAIRWLQGDVQNFAFPDQPFGYVLHGAMTSAAETYYRTQSPLDKYDLVVNGSRRVLDFAVRSGARKVLLLSSGPAYGRQPADMTHIPESYCGAPAVTDSHFDFSVLGEAKRVAELMSTVYAEQYGLQVAIARCFSFVGPHLPLDLHYAIGNFIGDVLQNRPIRVRGDGSPIRSYLYMSDTMVWLWRLLLSAVTGLFNVGSDRAHSIAEIAELVNELSDNRPGVIVDSRSAADGAANRYVPSTQKILTQLGLQQSIDIETAIAKTLRFYGG